jgi:SAM-dependent methyltransferase
MADVDHYNSWIFRLMRPFVGRRVVEVGCGLGNMTGYFLRSELRPSASGPLDQDSSSFVLAFDLLPESVEWVSEKYRGDERLMVREGDVCDQDFIEQAVGYGFDTVASINMLEHVKDDARALAHMHKLIQPGGCLLLFVPAMPALYGALDKALGHYRRYSKKGLRALVRGAGFDIHELYYVNLAGVPGWFLNSRVLRRQLLPRNQLGLFNLLAPTLERAEAKVRPPVGQSLLCIARKRET